MPSQRSLQKDLSKYPNALPTAVSKNSDVICLSTTIISAEVPERIQEISEEIQDTNALTFSVLNLASGATK
jgi:hypothetical protein